MYIKCKAKQLGNKKLSIEGVMLIILKYGLQIKTLNLFSTLR